MTTLEDRRIYVHEWIMVEERKLTSRECEELDEEDKDLMMEQLDALEALLDLIDMRLHQ